VQDASVIPDHKVDVSVLIVCYKALDLIGDCLRGLYAHTTGCRFEVLLLDCSNDGTVEFVRTSYPRTRLIENTENLGFGRGNNRLAEFATGRYLVLLNPDTLVHDDAIGELFRTAEATPGVGAVGGWARRADGSRDPGCQQFLPTFWRLTLVALGGARLLNGAIPENATAPGPAEILSGAFMLVPADVWREVGGFDTSFFMYSEEVDLCYRISRTGRPVIMTPRAEITHLVGGGSSLNPRRTLMITTARMHFLRKFWSPASATIGGFLLWLWAAFRFFGGSLLSFLPFKRDRALALRDSYRDIVLSPRLWWRGYQPKP
jgi:GT2 family glycosyltransferase